MSRIFDDIVQRALEVRKSLLADPSVSSFRVFNGQADGVPGFVLDKFADVLIAQLHEERLRMPRDEVRVLADAFRERLGATAVYRKHFVRDRAKASPKVDQEHRSAEPWIGAAAGEEITIEENGLRFLIRPYDGFSVGLFLEQRDNRRWVREQAANRRVLNLFAYTCGFSVAAAAGGAAHVASVDLYKRYLEWGKANFAANPLSLEGPKFYCSDTLDFYGRARRQKLMYDLVILDPPTFSRESKSGRVFVLEKELEKLCAGAVGLLTPGGQILLCTNDRGISRTRMEEALRKAAERRRLMVTDRPELPIDFAGDRDYAKSVIAVVG